MIFLIFYHTAQTEFAKIEELEFFHPQAAAVQYHQLALLCQNFSVDNEEEATMLRQLQLSCRKKIERILSSSIA